MPRLIILLLTIASLTILTLQNLSSENEVPLVLFGQVVSENILLGWLLLGTVGIGALLTLVLYGLIGLRRPPESKYKPMGRRVPYPDGPDSSTSPTSSPNNDVGTPAAPIGYAAKDYGSSSAFVSEPGSSPASSPSSSPSPDSKPFISPPQDTSPSTSSSPAQSMFQSKTYPSTYASPDSSADSQPRSKPRSGPRSFMQQPIGGLKSALGIKSGSGLGKKKDRRPADESPSPNIGEGWGELRTTEQRNQWEVGESDPSNLEAGARSLFEFGRSVGTNAGRIADDIASGWNNQSDSPSPPDYDPNRDIDDYAEADYDSLDRGWENFDDYSDSPPDTNAQKRTYGDSLYGADAEQFDSQAAYRDSAYRDDAYPENTYPEDTYREEVDSDDVYEADYRVIEPPSKPLPSRPLPSDPSDNRGDEDNRYTR